MTPYMRALIATIVALVTALLTITLSTAEAHARPLEWGISPTTRDATALRQQEADLGRRFDTVRVFVRWDQPFPDAYHRALVADGRRLLFSVAARRVNGDPVRWAAIATPGTREAREADAWVQRVEAFPGIRTFTLSHEPELVQNQDLGTAPDYVRAWRAFITRFRATPAPHPQPMLITTANAWHLPTTDRRHPSKWYPGDGWVGSVAIDAYNWHTCRPGVNTPWRSLREMARPLRDWGATRPHLELRFAEWGTVEDDAEPWRKAQWIRDARTLLDEPGWGQFVGLSYFDHGTRADSCEWVIGSSTASRDAFRAFGLAAR